MAPLALPGRGKSKAADTTTTSTTYSSASVEVSNANSLNSIEGAADSSLDDLFGGRTPEYSSNYINGECDPANVDGDHNDFMLSGEAFQLAMDDTWAIAATSHSTSEQSIGMTGSGPSSLTRTVQDLATVANDNTLAPTSCAHIDLALPGPAPVIDTPATSSPVKRPRGRPPGKSPPKEKVTYRCRYGCRGHHVGGPSLRKHMMKVHGIFSSAHTVQKCPHCGRTFDPKIKDLVCNKPGTFCPKLSEAEIRKMNVHHPRDDQETADTFVYDGSGPSALVIVAPGDDETELRQACADAIENWPHATYSRPQLRDGLVAPENDVPVSRPPAYEGKGKKRVIEAPSQEEPTPKRAERVIPVSAPQSSQDELYAASSLGNVGFVGENNSHQSLASDNEMPYSSTEANAHVQNLATTLVNQYDQIGTSFVGANNGSENLTFDNEMPSSNTAENVTISDLATDLLNDYDQMISGDTPAEQNITIPDPATDSLNDYDQMFSGDTSNGNTEENINVSALATDLLNDYNQMFPGEAPNDLVGFD